MAPDSKVPPSALLAQAANVWLLAGELARAKLTIGVAARMAPDNAAILVDKARISAEGGAWAKALAALDAALRLAPDDSDALAFRASALRRLDRLDEALGAVEAALELDPENASAWLERGLVRRARGDLAGAEADWSETLRRFDGTPAADAARAELAGLEKKPK